MDTVKDWLGLVAAHWPPADAASWDAVGLQVGDPQWPVERVLVSLDVTAAVLDEAVDLGEHTLVLAHHPMLLGGLERLTPSSAAGRLALQAAGSGVAVAAAHTNLDVARDGTGTSDPVAHALGLTDLRPLQITPRDSDECKLVTFVPSTHTDAVLDALAEAGAGTIGLYERCSFRVAGQGTFRPRAEAAPYSGRVGQDNVEPEDRLEVVVPRRSLGPVVERLRAMHPYEEVAYDLYPLLDGAERGIGVVGRLPRPTSLAEVAATVADRLPAPHLRVAGDRDRVVEVVAAVGGSGSSYGGAALAAGADVLVTGDLKHHTALDLLSDGLAVIDAGHHATEQAAMPAFVAALAADASAAGLAAPVLASSVDTDPFSSGGPDRA